MTTRKLHFTDVLEYLDYQIKCCDQAWPNCGKDIDLAKKQTLEMVKNWIYQKLKEGVEI